MILIFGGTSDSLVLAKALEEAGYHYILSVATSYGKQLADQKVSMLKKEEIEEGQEVEKNKRGQVMEGRLNLEAMEQLIKEKNIQLILDATHPYAIEVSQNAIAVSESMNIPYLRYERPSLLEEISKEKVHIVKDVEEACKVAHTLGETIFLGTGSKTLGAFVEGLPDKKLVARVLPTSQVITECETLGLSPENIIGMKGPFSEAMNKALYQHYKVDCLITKESGAEGGFLEKVRSCLEEGIEVIVIKRDTLAYPKMASSIESVMQQVEALMKK